MDPKLAARFWVKVDRDGPRVRADLDECWVWTGALTPSGYGFLHVRPANRHWLAHRVSFLLTHGRWPEPCACHRCDNKACVRPSHIFEGTLQDNNADKCAKGRQPRGEAAGLSKLTECTAASWADWLDARKPEVG